MHEDRRAGEPAQSPHRHRAYERRGIGKALRGERRQARLAAIANRDEDVADEAVASGALQGRAGKARAKSRIVEPDQLGQFGWRGARSQFRLARDLREFVPGANREAIIAAIDAVADGRPEFDRDVTFVLDGEIGDATP